MISPSLFYLSQPTALSVLVQEKEAKKTALLPSGRSGCGQRERNDVVGPSKRALGWWNHFAREQRTLNYSKKVPKMGSYLATGYFIGRFLLLRPSLSLALSLGLSLALSLSLSLLSDLISQPPDCRRPLRPTLSNSLSAQRTSLFIGLVMEKRWPF